MSFDRYLRRRARLARVIDAAFDEMRACQPTHENGRIAWEKEMERVERMVELTNAAAVAYGMAREAERASMRPLRRAEWERRVA